MKAVKKSAFPILLVLTCFTVHFWQHAVASLPYLPNNGIIPLSVLTPTLLVLTFLTTYVMLRQSRTARPVRRSLLSAAGMLVPVLATGVFFLSYLTYRYAAVLPVFIVLPDWPTGIVTMIITLSCLVHLTALLICRFIKQKTGAGVVIAAAVGWLLLNCLLFLVTT
ncbi:MAG: hypothetical protein K6C36_03805 [Clostridia bacterium]|nr:hypothetical protein [Clostridia bacterium]